MSAEDPFDGLSRHLMELETATESLDRVSAALGKLQRATLTARIEGDAEKAERLSAAVDRAILARSDAAEKVRTLRLSALLDTLTIDRGNPGNNTSAMDAYNQIRDAVHKARMQRLEILAADEVLQSSPDDALIDNGLLQTSTD